MKELEIPLKIEDFIKYLVDNQIDCNRKNNVIVFSSKEKNGITAVVICDNENIKYIRYRFMNLGWNEKNQMVEYLDKNYNLISHTLANNTRTYEKYNAIFTYCDLHTLEATFLPLDKEEEKLKKKIIKKQNSSFDVNDFNIVLTLLLNLIFSLV